MQFEDILVNVPIGYEKILERNYENWKIPDKTCNDHNLLFYDVKKSYSYNEIKEKIKAF